nr:hypothetical protein [Tessaracoccus coleopterorum]
MSASTSARPSSVTTGTRRGRPPSGPPGDLGAEHLHQRREGGADGAVAPDGDAGTVEGGDAAVIRAGLHGARVLHVPGVAGGVLHRQRQQPQQRKGHGEGVLGDGAVMETDAGGDGTSAGKPAATIESGRPGRPGSA